MAVGPNIIFDPTREELAVAECVFAVTIGGVLAVRTIDPPSRLTPPGINTDTGPEVTDAWSPPKGGVKRVMLSKMIKMIVQGSILDDIHSSLANV
jgi:exosome complex component RRP42